MLGVGVYLVAGKPIGVVGATWLAVGLGWCRLAPRVTWSTVGLVGLLAGIGFTMSIFIAMLAFTDQKLQNAVQVRCVAGFARCSHARPRLGHGLRSTPGRSTGPALICRYAWREHRVGRRRQSCRQCGSNPQRRGNAGDGRRPPESIEHLTEHRGSDQAT